MKRIYYFILLTGAFLILTISYSWPLILRFSTYAAGDAYDGVLFVWDLWWVKKAFLDLHKLPFSCDYIFYPVGINLVFHTLHLFNGIVSIPLQLIFGLIPVHNLLYFFSFIMSGLGMYLLCFYLTESRGAAFLTALMFAFCPFKLHHASHFNLLSTEWMPFYIYFLLKGFKKKSFLYGLPAGLFLVLTFYCSYYLAAFLMVFTLFFLIYDLGENAFMRTMSNTDPKLPGYTRFIDIFIYFFLILCIWTIFSSGGEIEIGMLLISVHTSKNIFIILLFLILLKLIIKWLFYIKRSILIFSKNGLKDYWRKFLIIIPGILIVFFVLILPYFFAVLNAVKKQGPVHIPTFTETKNYAAELEAFFVPVNTIITTPIRKLIPGDYLFDAEWCIFPGYITLLFFVYALLFLKRKDRYFWLSGAVFFLVLALGPYFSSLFLRFLPFIGGVRVPARYGLMMMMCLYIITGMGIADIFSKINKKGYPSLKWVIGFGLFFIILFEFMIVPFSGNQLQRTFMTKLTIPGGYEIIAQKKDKKGCILEFPLGWKDGYRSIGYPQSILQYYQSYHQWRIISGDVSRIPEATLEFIKENPVLMAFSSLEFINFPDEMDFRRFCNNFEVKYIVVHKQIISGRHNKKLKEYLMNISFIERIFSNDDMDIYKIAN